MVGFWCIYACRELCCHTQGNSSDRIKLCYQISVSLLSTLFLLEVAVFFADYFILLAITNEMQSLSTGGIEKVDTIATIGSSTPTPPG